MPITKAPIWSIVSDGRLFAYFDPLADAHFFKSSSYILQHHEIVFLFLLRFSPCRQHLTISDFVCRHAGNHILGIILGAGIDALGAVSTV